jgi:hypothetical protein
MLCAWCEALRAIDDAIEDSGLDPVLRNSRA